MNISSPIINRLLFAFCGVAFALPSLVFIDYTGQLIWLNLTMENAADYRSNEMLFVAIGFPLASILLGFTSWFFINRARKASS